MPTPPNYVPNLIADNRAETMVIGYLLAIHSIDEAELILTGLDCECFHNPQRRVMYQAIHELTNQGIRPDLNKVKMQIDHQHPDCEIRYDQLVDCLEAANGTLDISMYLDVLQEFKVRRSLQTLAFDLEKQARDTTASVSEATNRAITLLEAQDVAPQHRGKALHDIVPELRQRIDDNRNPATRHHGPSIGLDEIDSQGGLPESGLVVLAGGTSSGKSSVAAGILLHSADAGMKGLYISLEMPNGSLVSRMTAMRGRGLSAHDMLTRPLTFEGEFRQALGDLDSLDRRYGEMLYFDDSRTTNLDDICSSIRYMAQANGIRVAVVDFVQLLSFTMQSRLAQTTVEQLMAKAARCLKNLADHLSICIVMVSQLNRNTDRQRPTMGSVRDSGQIAEAADMLILTWRPQQYGGQYDQDLARYSPIDTMALLVVKNREGSLQNIIAHWDGQRTLMRQLTSLERSLATSDERGQGQLF